MANNHTYNNLFFLSRMYAYFSMLLEQMHTLQLFFSLEKKNTERSVCVMFLFEKNIKIVKFTSYDIEKVYI